MSEIAPYVVNNGVLMKNYSGCHRDTYGVNAVVLVLDSVTGYAQANKIPSWLRISLGIAIQPCFFDDPTSCLPRLCQLDQLSCFDGSSYRTPTNGCCDEWPLRLELSARQQIQIRSFSKSHSKSSVEF
ncbi:unnamed protein product [Notodromas monacha]|uniref:Uncharacterized protein n=1 Tax=Notodromas monacha TaxID=399045 RepID=A0A7R9BQV1_9CRUS|nr:unnamed protein product [Notodromas monacha]CAG0920026.1 unnamed protein product [Notodromas monacha]